MPIKTKNKSKIYNYLKKKHGSMPRKQKVAIMLSITKKGKKK